MSALDPDWNRHSRVHPILKVGLKAIIFIRLVIDGFAIDYNLFEEMIFDDATKRFHFAEYKLEKLKFWVFSDVVKVAIEVTLYNGEVFSRENNDELELGLFCYFWNHESFRALLSGSVSYLYDNLLEGGQIRIRLCVFGDIVKIIVIDFSKGFAAVEP
jgi:hypothetical protein